MSAGLLAGVILIAIGVAGAVTTSYALNQSIPTTTAPTAGLTAACTATKYDPSGSAATATAAALVFNCGAAPAFTIDVSGSPTPAFSAPSTVSDLYLIPSGVDGTPTSAPTAANCSAVNGFVLLQSGAATPSLGVSSSWDYCINTLPGASVTGFLISWS